MAANWSTISTVCAIPLQPTCCRTSRPRQSKPVLQRFATSRSGSRVLPSLLAMWRRNSATTELNCHAHHMTLKRSNWTYNPALHVGWTRDTSLGAIPDLSYYDRVGARTEVRILRSRHVPA